MPRNYTVALENVAIAAATTDICEINPASNKPTEITGWRFTIHSEEADATHERLRVALVQGNTTSGSGGSAVTPRPMDSNDTAYGGTVEVGNTTAASAGTAVNLLPDVFGTDWPWLWGDPAVPDGFGFRVVNNVLAVFRFLEAPADSVSINGYICLREL